MSAIGIHATIKTIISMRKRLIDRDTSGKNKITCLRYISELNNYMAAYGSKWDSKGWRDFARRNETSISYLIPDNKSGETIKKKFYAELYNHDRRNE